MRSSGLEGSVIHTHGDDTSIFPVSKQTKLKLFLDNYRSFASIRLQKNTAATPWPFPSHCRISSCSQTSMHPFRCDNARIHSVPRHLLSWLPSNWGICYNRWNNISTWVQLSVRKYRVIQKDGLNFVRLYFLNYTWYVNDLHNIWKRRSEIFKYHH